MSDGNSASASCCGVCWAKSGAAEAQRRVQARRAFIALLLLSPAGEVERNADTDSNTPRPEPASRRGMRPFTHLNLGAMLFLSSIASLSAQSRWSGAGPDDRWSTPQNWQNG